MRGYNRVNIERSLGLPIGSLEDEEFLKLPETQALLKMIEACPWLIKVADSGFDKQTANRELVKAGIDSGLLENMRNYESSMY